jgi:aromatic ring-opening dioxygenase LigB subunit
MTMIYACIAPHDGNLIPETVDDKNKVSLTRKALQGMGKRLQSLEPEVIVIINPHGFRVHNAMSICIAEKALGDWAQDVKLEFDLNPRIANAIADEATDMGVPVARYIYGASGGASCFIPLDWGAVIPLYFMGHRYEPKPNIVHISPMKNLSYQMHYDFGSAIGRVVRNAPERIAIIASADQGHAHNANGPYGYDPASARYDDQMQEIIKRQDLDKLLSIDPGFVEDAKPDSLWPTLILAGTLSENPMQGRLLSYEVDQYFGILCAEYQP